MPKKVVLLEFNEICPPLIERWLGESKLPNFRRLRERADVFVSAADETNPTNLEPWIQWYSIHTGRPYSEHKVFHLTDGPKANHPDLWHILADAGFAVMNCGSMNAKGLTGERAFFLPDPWCDSEAAWPKEVAIFAKVIAKSVQEYSNTRVPLSKRDYGAFLSFILRHGLSFATVSAILSQLAAEKLSHNDVKWRRVALLDRLQFDLFAHYWRARRPDFATFFSNSTAHLQHAYWRHMDPGAFTLQPSERELAAYGDAVYFGYASMDRLIGQTLRLVGEDTVIILCSALSQQPYLKWETKGGQRFYRLHNVSGFLGKLGVMPLRVEPVMTHQYLARFADETSANAAASCLRAISINGTRLFGVAKSVANSIEFGCEIFTSLSGEEALSGVATSNQPVRVSDILYPIEAMKSGCHHPEGVLWIRNGRHAVHREVVSILDIAPTVCELLGFDLAVMRQAGVRGSSLCGVVGAAPLAA